jgi:hypothetical protein
MTAKQYKQHQRNIRDNGLRYTLERASASDSQILRELDRLAKQTDMLQWRSNWIAQNETAPANVIKLTSPCLKTNLSL